MLGSECQETHLDSPLSKGSRLQVATARSGPKPATAMVKGDRENKERQGTRVNRRVSKSHQQHSFKSGAYGNDVNLSELKFPVSKTGPTLPVLQGVESSALSIGTTEAHMHTEVSIASQRLWTYRQIIWIKNLI